MYGVRQKQRQTATVMSNLSGFGCCVFTRENFERHVRQCDWEVGGVGGERCHWENMNIQRVCNK